MTPSHLGKAISQNPGYLKLRKIRAAQAIANTVSLWYEVVTNYYPLTIQIARSQNRVYLNAETLMLNLGDMELSDV